MKKRRNFSWGLDEETISLPVLFVRLQALSLPSNHAPSREGRDSLTRWAGTDRDSPAIWGIHPPAALWTMIHLTKAAKALAATDRTRAPETEPIGGGDEAQDAVDQAPAFEIEPAPV